MSIKSKKKERITTPAYGHPSLKGGELMLAFLLALFLNLPHLFAQSPNYHIGDVITNPDGSKGVVFWLAPDGSGGWMCALNDVSGTYKWSTQDVNISGFPALPTPNANWQGFATITADTAGYSHTQRLRAAGNATTYPAAYAVDFSHGWYLPAIGQLLKLYAQQATISAVLTANGGSEISRTNHYWSSTYATTSNAYNLYNPSGYWQTASKSTAYYIRPVRSFGIQNSDLEISYQWSTGDTTASIAVSPDTTTTYQVVVTNETGCSDTVDFTLYVNSPISQSITETTCGSYEWHGQTYTESGTYTYAHEDTHGCQQVDTLHLTINYADTVRFNDTVCQGEPYTGHGFNIPADSTMMPHVIIETVSTPSLRTGCDSTIILTLTVHALTSETLNVTVIENDLPYVLNGMSYDTAGTYVQRLTNAAGCDSILTLNLTVHLNQTTYLDSAICADELPLTWNGVTFNEAGTRSVDLTASTGADSTVVMTLHVNALTSETLNVTILESDLPYILNGTSYDTAGTFVQHLTNANGCDSTLMLNLAVHYNQTTYVDSTVCADELPLTWNGVTFNEAGTQSATLTASTGADSTVVMTLTVHALTSETLNVTVIENDLPYVLNGMSYDTAGTYVQRLTNANGCDSTLTLNLTVYRNVTAAVDSSICADQLPFTWNGVTFNEAGTQFALLTTSAGADSTVVMTLTVHALTTETLNITVIETNLPYFLNGMSYDTAGTYVQRLTNAAGCDSILTLNLTVHYNQTTHLDSAICADQLPLTWNGVTFNEAGTQNITHTAHTGADSTVAMTLTVHALTSETLNVTVIENNLPYVLNGTEYDTAGTYVQRLTNVNGCDSTLTLNLTVYRNVTAAVDSSICADQLPFTWNGVTFNEAGTRTVTLIAHNGIDSVLTMTLHVNPMPRITANLTNINCHGDSKGSIAASAVQGTQPYSYQWTREQAVVGTSATITDLATGTYHLHVSDAHGCEADSSFTLVSLFAHTHDTVTAVVCQGEPFDEMGFHIPADSTMVPRIIVETVYTPSLQTGCDSVVTLLLTVNPAYHFNEELTLCDYDLPFTFRGTVIEPGVPAISTIDFSYNTVNGCDSIFTLDLMVVETDLKIVSSTDFCEEAQTELMAQTDLENYRWSTGEETNQIHISAPGNYSVTAATGSCEATALINIPECELNLYLPNAITPGNVDGLNDYFSIDPYTQKFIGEFEIWIYDRWGELVFYSADKNFKWNGEVGGELYPNTMYSYRIRYTKKIGKWFVEKGVVIVM